MHRLFGTSKPKEPTPSLGDATTSINNRVKALDEKIAGLDGELMKFKVRSMFELYWSDI